jgi:hypothetical protein
MRVALTLLLALAAGAPGRGAAAAPAPVELVFAAPGYPGTTEEAQPALDALAAAAAKAAGWPDATLTARYEPTEPGGLARLREPRAAVALVPLPFLVAHGAALKLRPRLAVEPQGRGAEEAWTLVARKGRVARPEDLAGMSVLSTAGYAPAFVRGALSAWGRIPEGAKVAPAPQILSALRKAATTGDVAVLLDGAQAAALPSLPFAADLDVVARSAPLPAAVLATIGDRLPPARAAALEKALLGLRARPGGAAALDGLQLNGFAPLDEKKLQATLRALAGKAP